MTSDKNTNQMNERTSQEIRPTTSPGEERATLWPEVHHEVEADHVVVLGSESSDVDLELRCRDMTCQYAYITLVR